MANLFDRIKCVFITPKDFDRAVEFGMKFFLHDEPLCRSMGLKVSPGCEYYFRNALEQENSVMAIDTSNDNQIVGLRGHRVLKRNEPEEYDPPKDELWDRLYQSGAFAFEQVDPWGKYDVDVMLKARFLVVHRDYRGMNIGVKMTEFTFDFMRREKIPLFYFRATNEYSKNVVRKCGFEEIFELKYVDYKVDGKQVFCLPEMHPSMASFIKWIG